MKLISNTIDLPIFVPSKMVMLATTLVVPGMGSVMLAMAKFMPATESVMLAMVLFLLATAIYRADFGISSSYTSILREISKE